MIDGLCNVERPKEFKVGEGHHVSCWLFKDVQ